MGVLPSPYPVTTAVDITDADLLELSWDDSMLVDDNDNNVRHRPIVGSRITTAGNATKRLKTNATETNSITNVVDLSFSSTKKVVSNRNNNNNNNSSNAIHIDDDDDDDEWLGDSTAATNKVSSKGGSTSSVRDMVHQRKMIQTSKNKSSKIINKIELDLIEEADDSDDHALFKKVKEDEEQFEEEEEEEEEEEKENRAYRMKSRLECVDTEDENDLIDHVFHNKNNTNNSGNKRRNSSTGKFPIHSTKKPFQPPYNNNNNNNSNKASPKEERTYPSGLFSWQQDIFAKWLNAYRKRYDSYWNHLDGNQIEFITKTRIPASLQELAEIPGYGESKAKIDGPELLATIYAFCQKYNLIETTNEALKQQVMKLRIPDGVKPSVLWQDPESPEAAALLINSSSEIPTSTSLSHQTHVDTPGIATTTSSSSSSSSSGTTANTVPPTTSIKPVNTMDNYISKNQSNTNTATTTKTWSSPTQQQQYISLVDDIETYPHHQQTHHTPVSNMITMRGNQGMLSSSITPTSNHSQTYSMSSTATKMLPPPPRQPSYPTTVENHHGS